MKKDILTVLNQVLTKYDLPGEIEDVKQCTNGHINGTYRVTLVTPNGLKEHLIIQKINNYVFKKPETVMHNIQQVANHVANRKSNSDCDIITFFDTKSGKNHTIIEGEYWRICQFVKDSVTYDLVENSKVLYSAGFAFGRFQALLSDLPMEKLHVTIPDFHNTRKRLADFFEIVVLDPLGRATGVQEEIAFFEEHRTLATKLCDLEESHQVPQRVTHNDTKYNNILMHKETMEPLCVIDLDTVMPGLAMHDFGDAIRFAANTAVEDETDLSKVGLNLEHYQEFTKGFMAACENLTPNEIATMALGAVTITIELASRFLLDHISGDKYFQIHRDNHNLDRARCQIRLAEDMIEKLDEMNRIVYESLPSKNTAYKEVALTKSNF
ncbi:MAG: aminoglycoside phosphotransferase family protein [Firmicutes bacterium]|nr:aminoglycoside phosphotransferase family protein [Bacillota bacterium]MDD4694765.1 aminoglycoside phosphotransferase family protein [Bacillota bacterium]